MQVNDVSDDAVRTFSKVLHHWRKACGRTQADIEAEVGLAAGTMSRLESGTTKRGPDKATCTLLAQAIGVDPRVLWEVAAPARLSAIDPDLAAWHKARVSAVSSTVDEHTAELQSFGRASGLESTGGTGLVQLLLRALQALPRHGDADWKLVEDAMDTLEAFTRLPRASQLLLLTSFSAATHACAELQETSGL